MPAGDDENDGRPWLAAGVEVVGVPGVGFVAVGRTVSVLAGTHRVINDDEVGPASGGGRAHGRGTQATTPGQFPLGLGVLQPKLRRQPASGGDAARFP